MYGMLAALQQTQKAFPSFPFFRCSQSPCVFKSMKSAPLVKHMKEVHAVLKEDMETCPCGYGFKKNDYDAHRESCSVNTILMALAEEPVGN